MFVIHCFHFWEDGMKKFIVGIGILFIGIAVFFALYLFAHKPTIIQERELGNPDMVRKVLIASQGTDFKNMLIDALTTHLQQEDVYIKIIDITQLPTIDHTRFSAILILHDIEFGHAPHAVQTFLNTQPSYKRIICVSTSGSETQKEKDRDIDTITSASKAETLPKVLSELISRITLLINQT